MKHFARTTAFFCLLFAGWLGASFAAAQDKSAEKPTIVLEPGGHTAAVRAMAFTSDGRELISLGGDETIRFWDVQTGELMRVLRLPQYGVTSAMALAPKGRLLAVGLANSRKEPGIALISLPADGSFRHLVNGNNDPTRCLAFSPDGKLLASGGQSGIARIWHVDTGQCQQTLRGHRGGVNSLAFSPDGRRLATCSSDLTGRIWDVESGAEQVVLQDPKYRTGNWTGLAWSPDGKTIVNGCYGQGLRVWNADGTLRERIYSVGGSRSMTFTKDSKALLFAGSGGRLLDMATKEIVAEFRLESESTAVALSPDERVAATSGTSGEDLFLWRIGDERLLHKLAGAGATPRGSGWSPDGKLIAWGTARGGSGDWLKLDALHVRHPLERSFDVAALDFGPAPRPDWRRHRSTSPDLQVERFISGGYTNGWVIVREADAILCTIKQPWTRCFTFLPDERLVLGGEIPARECIRPATALCCAPFAAAPAPPPSPRPPTIASSWRPKAIRPSASGRLTATSRSYPFSLPRRTGSPGRRKAITPPRPAAKNSWVG